MKPATSHLLDLPLELLELIHTFSPNPLLHRVNHQFYLISTNEQRKVDWLIHRYGKDTVLSHCWNLKFMNQTKEGQGCNCKKQRQSECKVESRQLTLVSALLTKGCTLSSGTERCLDVAAKQGHFQLLSYLLYRGGNPNTSPTPVSWFTKPKLKHKFTQINTMRGSEIRGPKRASLFLNAVKRNDLLLVELLLNEPMTPSPDSPVLRSAFMNSATSDNAPPLIRIEVSDTVLNDALSLSLLKNLPEMSLLLSQNNAHTRPATVTKLFFNANNYRILTGSRTAFTERIATAIRSMTLPDFDRNHDRLIRCCAEIGCVQGMEECIRRGVNVNHENGMALYTSLYCGNSGITHFLISSGANVHLITTHRIVFCVGMITVEVLALLLVLLLGVIWVFQVSFGSDVSGLTAMIVPTSFALFVMYRFVPVHSVVGGLRMVLRGQREVVQVIRQPLPV